MMMQRQLTNVDNAGSEFIDRNGSGSGVRLKRASAKSQSKCAQAWRQPKETDARIFQNKPNLQ
jgi:hypothetical protein